MEIGGRGGKGIMRRILLSGMITLIFFGSVLFVGCSEDLYIGEKKVNKPPEVWLSSGPVEGDTTGYQVHFYWGGWDPDGEITYYEFVVVDGNPFGFSAEDTTGIDKWLQTAAHDSVFRVTADDSARNVTINNNLYTRYDQTHTFFIRGVDQEGMRSQAVYRSFTAWTLAPYVIIDRPILSGVGVQTLSRVITFGWEGRDPIDSPSNTQDPEAVRYMWGLLIDTNGVYNPNFDMVLDMNENSWRYEEKWSPWIDYRAPGDSGRVTILGDDEILEMNKSHVFAVQAQDEAGAVTAIFDRGTNFRQFIVSKKAGPLLTVIEPFLGGFQFLGTNLKAEKRDLPPGVPLNFSWRGDASSYGGEIAGYRYGWDVADVNDPNDWEVSYSPFHRTAPERTLYSGVHTFFMEAIDNAGTKTLGQVEVNIVPFTMERNLMWVDDWPSWDFPQVHWAMPTETQHDQFWLGICSRAVGFDPERDVYDSNLHGLKPPEIDYVGKYKNIIWTYSNPVNLAWHKVVQFLPESRMGQGSQLTVNYLSIFLAKGGHLWTLGRADRTSGLSAVLIQDAAAFPMYLKCEITGNQEGCEGDTSGVLSMAYKDYCVSMLDKIDGILRSETPDMPFRQVRHFDVMAYGYRDDSDSYTAQHPDLPEQLDLWEEIICCERFFSPNGVVGGFTYVEIYDPEYWMERNYVTSQSCFHPMYRMRSKNSLSVLDHTTVAFWLTKYADIVPAVESGLAVAAPSYHFGFPLWFFDRDDVDQIVEVFFTKWQILSTP